MDRNASTSEPKQPDLFPSLLAPVDEQTVRCTRYMYRAIATNLDQDGLDDHQIVQFYNRRADASENRIKELRSDFNAAPLPCSDFGANGTYFMLCALAFNLLAILRLTLPLQWERVCATTIRHRLYATAGQVVRHAREWTLKLSRHQRVTVEEAIWAIRRCVLKPPAAAIPLL